MQNVSLNGIWKLFIAQNKDVKEKSQNFTCAKELLNDGLTAIEGSVPGNFELDLQKATGDTTDYFAYDNVLKLQELENRHLWYATEFDCDAKSDVYLKFEGIDTYSDIYLNGEKLGSTENMLIPYEFCCDRLIKEHNELLVHIYPTEIKAREFPLNSEASAQRYTISGLATRKAASTYGWDIMPRAISGGLWRNVSLIVKNPERFEECYMYTRRLSLDENYAECAMFYNIKIDGDFARDYEVEVEGECNGHKFYKKDKVWSFSDNCFIYVKDAQFWWPRNAGEPNLYNVTAKLLKNGKELDRKEFTLGIRSVELFYSKCVNEAGEGDFHFEINGKKIFMMGTNWVPMDPFHSRDKQRLPKALEMADDVGCNMMRCWGGNVYEDDDFYDFCDRHGIMIWQDFGMACGVYGVDDRFLGLIYDEAVAVIKRLRQHPCLALWSGDNECDSQNEPFYMAYHREPNENESTRRVIKKALRQHDFTRPYIPSSPYLIDVNMYDYRGENRVVPPEEHTWGPRDYFKSESYTKLLCYFASECGYHGCPSPQTLKKIIRPDQLWPIFEEGGKAKTDWQLHATCCEDEDGVQNTYRLPLMSSHVDTMFGGADNIEDFARRSQCSQAEAFKYFIERFRLEKWRRTGILWWNLVDGWPQISDAVVDYYYSKKLAYHFIKRSQNPVCVMVAEPQDGKYKIFAVNDLPQDKQVTVKITDLKNGKLLCESTFTAPADKSINFAELDEVNDLTMFKIEYSYDGKNYLNHYTTKTRDIKAEEYLDLLDKCGIAEFDF